MKHPRSHHTGKPAAEMNAAYQAIMDEQPLVTRCGFCGWTYTGTAYEGRSLAAGHRRVHHPELSRLKRRSRGRLTRFNPGYDEDRENGAAKAAEVARMLARREVA